MNLRPGQTRLGFIKESLEHYEAGNLKRWQLISRIIHIGLSAVEANTIADNGYINSQTLRRIT